MSTPGLNPASPLKLQFPQSLAVYDDYAKAQYMHCPECNHESRFGGRTYCVSCQPAFPAA